MRCRMRVSALLLGAPLLTHTRTHTRTRTRTHTDTDTDTQHTHTHAHTQLTDTPLDAERLGGRVRAVNLKERGLVKREV
jgi:hypothetical protein